MSRVLNPIVSESYMNRYIESEGYIKPSGTVTISENTTEPLDIAQYRYADVNVSGDSPILCTVTVINNTGAEAAAPLAGGKIYKDGYIDDDFNPIIPEGETVIYTLIMVKAANDYYNYGMLTDGLTSSMINCAINTGDYEGDVIPLDPTLPCSFTVTLS